MSRREFITLLGGAHTETPQADPDRPQTHIKDKI